MGVSGNRGVHGLLWEGGKTHAAPVPKGTPVKIPEPEGWTERYSRCSLVILGAWATGCLGWPEGAGLGAFKWRQR